MDGRNEDPNRCEYKGMLAQKQKQGFASIWTAQNCMFNLDDKSFRVSSESFMVAKVFRMPDREQKRGNRFDLLSTEDAMYEFAAKSRDELEDWIAAFIDGDVSEGKLRDHKKYEVGWDLSFLRLQHSRLEKKVALAYKDRDLKAATALEPRLERLKRIKAEVDEIQARISRSSLSSRPFHDMEDAQKADEEIAILAEKVRDQAQAKVGSARWLNKMKTWEIPYEDLEIRTDEELGKGSFGTVYKGHCLGVDVAIKSLPSVSTEKERKLFNKMLQAETKAFSRLNHPNIISMLHISIDNPSSPCLVLELAERGSLWDVLQQDPSIPMWQRLRFATDIACGMCMIHHKKIVHHDLKPQNCLLSKTMAVKVSDLGTATGIGTTFAATTAHAGIGGTLSYLAPEKLLCTEGLRDKPQVDVYAFAITLLEILTGSRVWEGRGKDEVQALVLAGKRPEIPANLDITPQLRELIARCWASQPTKRPLFTEILREIQEVAAATHADVAVALATISTITLVASTAAESLEGEPVMGYIEAMCKIHPRLLLGYDWAGSSSADNRDSEGDSKVDWEDSESVEGSFWFKGYCERVKGEILILAQMPLTRVRVLCIEGGPISQLEARAMLKLTKQVENDLGSKGLRVNVDVEVTTFEAFKRQFRAISGTEEVMKIADADQRRSSGGGGSGGGGGGGGGSGNSSSNTLQSGRAFIHSFSGGSAFRPPTTGGMAGFDDDVESAGAHGYTLMTDNPGAPGAPAAGRMLPFDGIEHIRRSASQLQTFSTGVSTVSCMSKARQWPWYVRAGLPVAVVVLLVVIIASTGGGGSSSSSSSSSGSDSSGRAYVSCTGSSTGLATAHCNAWQDLFHSTGGSSTWLHCASKISDPCGCSYNLPGIADASGVDCSSNTIRTLSLAGLGMTGTLPSSLSALKSSLELLYIFCNSLSGELPDLNYADLTVYAYCGAGGPEYDYLSTCAAYNYGANTQGNSWSCPLPSSFAFANTYQGCYASCTPAATPAPTPIPVPAFAPTRTPMPTQTPAPIPQPPTPAPTLAPTYVACTGYSASLPTAQCNAWQDLFHSTGGSSTWLYCKDSLTDPCSCSYNTPNLGSGNANGAISCSSNTITILGAYGLGMTGTLPSSLSALKSSLTQFVVDCNNLSGELPDLDYAKFVTNNQCYVGGPEWAERATDSCSWFNDGANTQGNSWSCPLSTSPFAFANTKAGCWASCGVPSPAPATNDDYN